MTRSVFLVTSELVLRAVDKYKTLGAFSVLFCRHMSDLFGTVLNGTGSENIFALSYM